MRKKIWYAIELFAGNKRAMIGLSKESRHTNLKRRFLAFGTICHKGGHLGEQLLTKKIGTWTKSFVAIMIRLVELNNAKFRA